jgi:hypothetical protein
MTALPTQMIDRWEHRADQAPGQDVVYWHVLMRDHPEVIALARHAQQRLATFPGLHMTPLKWLHMTTMVAGPAERFTPGQLDRMAETAAKLLADVPPITVTLGRILYHPEAIMLGVGSAKALAPIRNAAATATNLVTSDRRIEATSRTGPPTSQSATASRTSPQHPSLQPSARTCLDAKYRSMPSA